MNSEPYLKGTIQVYLALDLHACNEILGDNVTQRFFKKSGKAFVFEMVQISIYSASVTQLIFPELLVILFHCSRAPVNCI